MQNLKLEFIKNQLADNKLKCELQKVVSSVEALVPEGEEDFKLLQKFGLYPAEECQAVRYQAGYSFLFFGQHVGSSSQRAGKVDALR